YKAIASKHFFPVIIGQNFWHRLTGDSDFYNDLLEAIGSVAIEADYSKEFEEIISKLAKTQEIIDLSS
ncbi:MAG: restriction endonuclease, partial [Pedobacter sp.]